MTTMRAAVYHRFGGPEVVGIEQVPRPEPGPKGVLVRVHASTVSAADHRARSRDLPAGLAIPSSFVLGVRRPRRPILGMDVAGVVESIGAGVTRFRPGDRVIAMLGSRFGGHAEYAVIEESGAIAPAPTALSFGDAGALVFGGITARAFFRQGRLEPGARVLVNGASGAVGSAAVQLAAAAGALVTGVCSADNAELVRALGASRVIDYRVEDFAASADRYDIVMDAVGNAPVPRIRPVLADEGTALLVAGDLRTLVTATSVARRYGITVVASPGGFRAGELRELSALADAGRIRPVIDRRYRFDDIVAAHHYVDTGRKRGNVVIEFVD